MAVYRILPEYSKRLVALRLFYQLTQEQAAILLGISRQTLSSYETGERNPPITMLLKLAKLYKTTVSYICGEDVHETFDIEKFDKDTQNKIKTIMRNSTLNNPLDN